jgi:hypothetical protein
VRAALVAALLAAQVAVLPVPAFAQESDNVIDARVRASADAAESYQGPLDGGWTLVSASGEAIYAFQLVDKPGGHDPLEGVWRDLRHTALPGDINFIDTLTRGPDGLVISFAAKPGDPPVTITLKTGPDGAWTGDLKDGATDTPVKLRRG